MSCEWIGGVGVGGCWVKKRLFAPHVDWPWPTKQPLMNLAQIHKSWYLSENPEPQLWLIVFQSWFLVLKPLTFTVITASSCNSHRFAGMIFFLHSASLCILTAISIILKWTPPFSDPYFRPTAPVEKHWIIYHQKCYRCLESSLFSPVFTATCKNPQLSFLLKLILCWTFHVCKVTKTRKPQESLRGPVWLGELAVPFVTSQRLNFQNCAFLNGLFMVHQTKRLKNRPPVKLFDKFKTHDY